MNLLIKRSSALVAASRTFSTTGSVSSHTAGSNDRLTVPHKCEAGPPTWSRSATKRVCRLLASAPSGFFTWRAKPPSNRVIRRAWLTDAIGQVHAVSSGTYGSRRVKAELADAHGQAVRKLISSIMTELGLFGLPTRRHRDKTNQPALDDRHHRASDAGGQAVLLLCAGRLFLPGGRMVVLSAAYGRDGECRPRHGHRRKKASYGERGPQRSLEPGQYTSIRYSERLEEIGAALSIGSLGDSYN